MDGSLITSAMRPMHERSNGLGGGFGGETPITPSPQNAKETELRTWDASDTFEMPIEGHGSMTLRIEARQVGMQECERSTTFTATY